MKKVKLLLSSGRDPINYVHAFTELGAEVTAGYLPEVDTTYDGLVLCGGTDIDPARYGEPPDGSLGIDSKRDEVEFALLEAYLRAGKPVLGICRGHQLINVFFGGSLYQHLPEADCHTGHKGIDNVHQVTALPDSIVGRLHGEKLSVNSSHHQAVKKLGTGLRATALWQGQYVEAMEHTSLPVFCVQWHPERMCFDKSRNDTVGGAKILEYFLSVCERQMKE